MTLKLGLTVRPFRFGLQAARVTDPAAWTELARLAESSGYSSLMIPDHLPRLATFPSLMAAAAVTTSLKLTTYVLNQDFRPPGILAQEAATVQLFTNGRLELGIGAGWAEREYVQAGLTYDPAAVRVARLLPRLFASLRTIRASGEREVGRGSTGHDPHRVADQAPRYPRWRTGTCTTRVLASLVRATKQMRGNA